MATSLERFCQSVEVEDAVTEQTDAHTCFDVNLGLTCHSADQLSQGLFERDVNSPSTLDDVAVAMNSCNLELLKELLRSGMHVDFSLNDVENARVNLYSPWVASQAQLQAARTAMRTLLFTAGCRCDNDARLTGAAPTEFQCSVKKQPAVGLELKAKPEANNSPEMKFEWPREPKTLMVTCCVAIRERLLHTHRVNLFVSVPKLGLPSALENLLLHGVSLSDPEFRSEKYSPKFVTDGDSF